MARPFRIEFASALYHLTSRGDQREAIYEDDEDRQRFLDRVAEVAERYNWVCHAYCLMTNHYHLVAETVEGNLSQGMRHLNGVYTHASNPRNKAKSFLVTCQAGDEEGGEVEDVPGKYSRRGAGKCSVPVAPSFLYGRNDAEGR